MGQMKINLLVLTVFALIAVVQCEYDTSATTWTSFEADSSWIYSSSLSSLTWSPFTWGFTSSYSQVSSSVSSWGSWFSWFDDSSASSLEFSPVEWTSLKWSSSPIWSYQSPSSDAPDCIFIFNK